MTDSDISGALAILAVAADPIASKKRLDELVAERESGQKALADAAAAQKDVADKLNDLTIREAALLSHKAELDAQEKANETRHIELLARESSVVDGEARLNASVQAKNAMFDAREKQIRANEVATQIALDGANTNAEEAAKLKAEYADRLDRIKAAVG